MLYINENKKSYYDYKLSFRLYSFSILVQNERFIENCNFCYCQIIKEMDFRSGNVIKAIHVRCFNLKYQYKKKMDIEDR